MKPSVWSCVVFPLILVSCAWAAPKGGLQKGRSSPGDDDGGIEMQDMSPKTLTMDRSCGSSDASRITKAFNQALDIAQSGISTVDWILIEYADSSNADEKRRLSLPLKNMAGDGTALRMNVDAKRNKMRDLRDIFKRVRRKTSSPLVAQCGDDFLVEDGPDETGPSCLDENKFYYWDTIRKTWVSMDQEKCANTPVFVYPGNKTYPDQLVFCPLGLQLLKEKAYVKELNEKSVSDLNRTFIDVLAVSPPAWIFQALLQTRQVGSYDNLDLGNGLRGYGWEGVRTLALREPWKWMQNAGTISYIALAWYMNKWNWGSGEATELSEKNPSILPTDYAERQFGKGKGRAVEEIDITSVRVLDPDSDPIYS
ncbi:uncharacterized protein N7459_002602 [Penicillium hispanicum]|uniref:uncharacterized protein n=1 Tax=Penicillium hispanicum TaxID=1080232 RepID=UPI0025410259|nr:uncharacterized protein N7459_002602 [Penicillium hispanicum]KAJ5586837.1 hypothetical protein N7459_002602 [Penicillium hispanicum]